MVVTLLFVTACLFLAFEPWHGPVVLALSERHGVDVGDLPALPLIALAVSLARGPLLKARGPTSLVSSRSGAALALALGILLIAGVLDPKIGSPLVPAGGGTFEGSTRQAAGRGAEPVGHWSDLTLTYDGAALRLYVDGARVSSLGTTGSIRRTSDPLWIGGNRPYGEYFRGAVDEVRVYNRALSPAAVRAAMSTPIRSGGSPPAPGLVAAYPFDSGSGLTAADASGHGNAGMLRGARWTRNGRFGGALSFDGTGEVVRVPASASLNFRSAMTLAAWVRPSESQSGWHTILARQTDAYFLMAGGGRERAAQLATLDNARFGLLIVLGIASFMLLASGRISRGKDRRHFLWPLVVLFVAGSLADAAVAPANTLFGPVLVAAVYAVTTAHRDESATAYGLAALFAVVTVISLVDSDRLPLPQDDGGAARAAAVGLLLVTSGLWTLRHAGARSGAHRGPSGVASPAALGE